MCPDYSVNYVPGLYHTIAQGNALGLEGPFPAQALKGRNKQVPL